MFALNNFNKKQNVPVFSAMLSKIFSSSLSCFSLAVSLWAFKRIYVTMKEKASSIFVTTTSINNWASFNILKTVYLVPLASVDCADLADWRCSSAQLYEPVPPLLLSPEKQCFFSSLYHSLHLTLSCPLTFWTFLQIFAEAFVSINRNVSNIKFSNV